MSKVYTIIYEESTPSRQKIAYYNSIAVEAGIELKWQPAIRTVDDYALLQDGTFDAVLLGAHDDFQEIVRNDLSVMVSRVGERRLIALFSSFLDLESEDLPALNITTEFDWQGQMASLFLAKALPFRKTGYVFNNMPEKRTTDERLYSVLKGETDVAIFSMADLNLRDAMVSPLRFMVLPLFECPPSIHQGITGLLIKKENSLSALIKEHADKEAQRHYHHKSFILNLYPNVGTGIFHMELPLCSFTYFSSLDKGRIRTGWKMDAEIPAGKQVFSTTDFMKDFFDYEYESGIEPVDKPVVFVASHKAIHSEELRMQLSTRRVWAAGTRTWFELAKKGIWVEGSADGLGLETLVVPWLHLLNIKKDEVAIITNKDSAKHWREDGWSAVGSYELKPALSEEVIDGIRQAGFIFWTSYQQYEACRQYLSPGLIHASPAGKTAVLLKKAGIEELVVFPSIKAYSWQAEKRGE